MPAGDLPEDAPAFILLCVKLSARAGDVEMMGAHLSSPEEAHRLSESPSYHDHEALNCSRCRDLSILGRA